jgi:hypothetical protein
VSDNSRGTGFHAVSTSKMGRRAPIRGKTKRSLVNCRRFECVLSFVMAESGWLFGGFTGGLTACSFREE